VLREVEPLLNYRCKFTDTFALFSQNTLCACGHDDNFSTSWGYSDFNTGVTFLSQFPGEELVELRLKDSIGDELKT